MTATEPRTVPLPQTQTAFNRLPPSPPPKKRVAFGTIQPQGHRIVLYGPGGIGKTTLAAAAPGPVAFIDLDESMPVLRSQLPSDLDIRLVTGVGNWTDLRATLQAGIGCLAVAAIIDRIHHRKDRAEGAKAQAAMPATDVQAGAS